MGVLRNMVGMNISPRWISEHGGWVPETEKIWWRLLPYCTGIGVDLGHGDVKIDSSATGIDISPRNGVTNVTWDLNNGLPEGYRSELDYVFSSHALEHLGEPEKRLGEWWEALKGGGHLVLYVPNKAWAGGSHGFTEDEFTGWLHRLPNAEPVLFGYHYEYVKRESPVAYSFYSVTRKLGRNEGISW